ncbi:MAG: MBOAT family protein [Clostridiales bacterium]|nr:MBOAT family protein [Clostridiales bacterium]
MIFSGITFLYLFFPIVLLLYAVVPKTWKNHVLLAASLLFYFCGEPVYVTLLIFSSFSDFFISTYIERHRGERKAKYALILSIIINLGLLGFFKYTDFLIGTVNDILGTSIPLVKVPLPVGISFFTFQTMSYTIDVYRGDAHAEPNFATFATFVCLFPQLVAGPIVRYTDISRELHERTTTSDDVFLGIRRFAFGLGKKVLLANALGELVSTFRAANENSVVFYWLYAVAYCLQVYFDFSGYSDMAIGIGRIFGFHFPENFNYPFISKSITEFWRRWHMTLGAWFRDYLYIPMGGNRVKKSRWFLNIFVVWATTGLWHGAAFNFILWGVYFGILLTLEKLFLLKWVEKLPAFLRHIYLLFIVMISFVIFNAASMPEILTDIGGLFGLGKLPLISSETLYYLRSNAVLIILGCIGATPLMRNLARKLEENAVGAKVSAVLTPVVTAILLIVCTAYLVDGSFNPFLYFRF